MPRFSGLIASISSLALALCLIGVPAHAGDRTGVQEIGFLAGWGPSSRDNIQLVPLYGRAAWLFPEIIDEPLHEHDIELRWVVEGWIAAVTDGQDAIEVGVSPIVLKLDYDAGQRFVPYGIGGVGAMYTGLQGQDLGGPFEFASFVGVGLHTFITDTVALTFQWDIRHISNAGLKEPNRGLNTNFFLIGLEFFPKRGS
ncbi:MAG: acyloxyacyl hydrolase [Deltaproteobacteria bacterium]|nr:acyloxyacyl hydrolase [Deltaproteobacteria bacterium]